MSNIGTIRSGVVCQPGPIGTFLVGDPESDHVRVDVQRRAYPDTEPEWLEVAIEVVARPFTGRYRAFWRAGFLPPFRRALESLYRTLEGTAELHPDWEGTLSLTLSGDGIGHVRIVGEACSDLFPHGTFLRFGLAEIDQTYLPALIDDLKAIEAEFPSL